MSRDTNAEPATWKYELGHSLRIKGIHIFRLAVSPDGTRLALARSDRNALSKPGEIALWSLDGKEPANLDGRALDYGPVCGPSLTMANSWPGAAVPARAPLPLPCLIWHPRRKSLCCTVITRRATALAFSKDAAVLFSTGYDGRIGIWDLPNAKATAFLTASVSGINALSMANDDRTLLAGGIDRTLRVFDIAAQKQQPPLEREVLPWGVSSAALTCDGKTAAAAFGTAGVKTGIAFWDMATRKQRPGLLQEDVRANEIVFTPDGEALITAGLDRAIRVWNIKTGTLDCMLKGHGGPVYGLGISADGSVLATSDYSLVQIWRRERK